MLFLDHLAEQKIAAARDAGELDNLPGQGKPLDLDDAPLVPEDVRVAFRILRNAGVVPPEVDARREMAGLSRLLRFATDDAARRRAVEKLAVLSAKLEAEGRALPVSYRDALLDRLER